MMTKPHQPLLVALRVRPMNKAECNIGAKQIAHTVDKNLVVLLDPNEDSDDILRANRCREKKYVFDRTFDPLSSQEEVYQHTTSNLIGYVTSGYNATVFAYGPTGAGKTYTMLGTNQDCGIMVLTLNDLFHRINETQEDKIYRVTMSYLEIYNEMIRDLLNPSSGILDLREDSSGAVVVAGLLEVETTSTQEVMGLLSQGNQRRTCEPTAVNKTSSRSHAILKVTVEQRSRVMNVTQKVRTGVLFMVDLAGSERAAITQNRGKRMIEGAHINRSLLALGNCINALGGNTRAHYVNYRDSKLTRLLKDSLGGNCRTVMIAHISPASSSFEESRNTLTYAERAKRIKTRVHQNVQDVSYHITQYHKIIAELRRKVHRLQEQLNQGGTDGHSTDLEINELCLQLKELSQEEKETRQELLVIECSLLQNTLESQRHVTCIHDWEQQKRSLSTSSSLPCQSEEPCTSPDSGADMSPIMEPLDVASSREELALLVADKQRMEAQHKRLQRHLKETRAKMAEVQERFSGSPGLLPLQKELFELLQRSCDLEAASLEYALSAALTNVQLARREGTIDQLLQQGAALLEVVEHQRALLEEHSVPLPTDLSLQYQEAAAQQRKLALQATAEKQLPLVSKLPTLARLSSKLYTTMTGSKSNLLVEDALTEETDASRGHTPLSPIGISDFGDIHLPAITNQRDPSALTLTIPHSPIPPSPIPPSPVALTLPPISFTKNTSLVANRQEDPEIHKENEECSLGDSDPVAGSSLDSKKSELEPLSTPGHQCSESSKTTNKPPSSSLCRGILSKVSSFPTPHISVSRCSTSKTKYIVPPSDHAESTLIDLEGTKTRLAKPRSSLHISQSQPQLIPAAKHVHQRTTQKVPVKNNTLPLSRTVLSEAARQRLRDNRVIMTVEELEMQYPSTHSTPLHQTGSTRRDVPGARRTGGGGSGVHVRREVARRKPPVPPLPRKTLLPRRELPLAKVTADGHFSNIVSPYLTPRRKAKAARADRGTKLSSWTLEKSKGRPLAKAAKPKR